MTVEYLHVMQVEGFMMNKFETELDSSIVDCLRWLLLELL